MADNVIPRIDSLDYDPTFTELLGASFRRENVVGSAIQWARHSSFFGDDDETPVTDAEINEAFQSRNLGQYIRHGVDVRTRGELNNKLNYLQQQHEDKETRERGGWSGFGTDLLAGALDVPTLIPFGHAVKLGRLGTEALGTTALKVAATSAIDATATETALHLTQDLRTVEESAYGVGGSMLLNTLLGTTAARVLSKRHHASLSERAETELPKIADGRFEEQVGDQVRQIADNTRRAMNGETLEPHLPPRDFDPGQRGDEFLRQRGVEPVKQVIMEGDNTQRSLMVGTNGRTYDLNQKYQSHMAWMRDVENVGDAALLDDLANFIQVTVTRTQSVPGLATGSRSPLTVKQLRALRKVAKDIGLDQRDLFVRELKDGVEVVSFKDHDIAKKAGYTSLSRYQSAEARSRQLEVAGRQEDPLDFSLREGDGVNPTFDVGDDARNHMVSFLKSFDRSVLTEDERSALASYGGKGESDIWKNPEIRNALLSAAQKFRAPRDLVVYRGETASSDLQARLDSTKLFTPVSLSRSWAYTMATAKWSYPGVDSIVIPKGTPILPIEQLGTKGEFEILIPPASGLKLREMSDRVWDNGSEEVRIRDYDARSAGRGGQTSDPELRQGLPTTRWDGGPPEVPGRGAGGPPDAPGGRGDGAGAGGSGGGRLPPPGSNSGGSGGGRSPYEPAMTPSQMAFSNSGGVINATRGLSRLLGGSPILEMMNAKSTTARAWIMRVAELSGQTKGADEGVANPIAVQSLLTEYEGKRAIMTRTFYDNYKKWKQGPDIMGRDYENFSRNVTQVMVRNTYDDADPAVAEAARATREVFDWVFDRAVEVGLVRKDAWKPGNPLDDSTGFNPFINIEKVQIEGTSTDLDVRDAADAYVKAIVDAQRAYELGKDPDPKLIERAEFERVEGITDKDVDLFIEVTKAVESGAARSPDTTARPTGPDGEVLDPRAPDYNIGVKLDVDPGRDLGRNLIASAGYLRRVYTDRLQHDREEFVRLESLAKLQRIDADILDARKWNAEQEAKIKAEAEARGADPQEALDNFIPRKEANEKLYRELNVQTKRARIIRALAHAGSSWEAIVHGTYRGLEPDSRRYMSGGNRRSPLLSRNVELSDQILLAKGWVDDDALALASHALRTVGTDIELARVFRRPMTVEEANKAARRHPDAYWVDGKDPTTVPDLAMSEPRKAIAAEYDAMHAAAKTDKERNQISNERSLMIGGDDASLKPQEGLVNVVTEQLRGTYKVTENSGALGANLNALRSYIFSARMGANVITSIPEVGATMLRHGFGNVLGHYAHRASSLVRTLSDGNEVDGIARAWGVSKERAGAILAREARAAGIAVETDLMSRVASQMDLMDPFANAKRKDSSFQQIASGLARAGSKLYLINVFANSMRKVSYGVYMDRVIRSAMNPEKIEVFERRWLNDLGIDDKLLASIRKEVVDNGGAELDGGVWHVRTDRWQDGITRSLFWAAGRKDVDTANVLPTAVEKPLGFSNPIVASLLQFWSFSFGATMRIMAQSMQHLLNGDPGTDGLRVVGGMLAMIALGMGSFALHNYASTWLDRQRGTLDPRDELPDWEGNWRQWMIQGVDRSGVGGVFSQAGSVLDNLGINPVRKAIRSFDERPELTDPLLRYGRPNAVKNLAGPTAGLIDDMITAGRGIAYGVGSDEFQVRRSFARGIARNTPFINAFWAKALTREALEYTYDEVLQLPPDTR